MLLLRKKLRGYNLFMILFESLFAQIIAAIFIILIFYFFKKIIGRFFFSFLEKLALRTKSKFDDKMVNALRNPFELFILIVGIYIAHKTIAMNEEVEELIENIIESAFTFVLFYALFRIISPVSNVVISSSSRITSKNLGKDLVNLITKFVQVIIIALGIITILQEWGYNITGFLASLGLVGMAIALAAKDTVANLFGSLVIFSDKPFKIGDWIKTPNAEGIVEAVGIRSTKIRTFAQALISVPNASLANSEILNWSKMGKRRIKMNLGLTYSTTTEQMNSILNDIRDMLIQDDNIHQETIHIYFTDFNDSSLGIFCYFFTKSTNWAEYMRVREKINLKIMQIVENNHAAFAFPSQSIYLENNEEIN